MPQITINVTDPTHRLLGAFAAGEQCGIESSAAFLLEEALDFAIDKALAKQVAPKLARRITPTKVKSKSTPIGPTRPMRPSAAPPAPKPKRTYNRIPNDQLDAAADAIHDLIANDHAVGGMTAVQIEIELPALGSDIRKKALGKLIRAGDLRVVGRGTDARYHLVDTPPKTND